MTAFPKLFLVLICSLVTPDLGLANETEICGDAPKAIFYESEDKSGNIVNYFEETEDYQHIQSIINKRGLKGIPLFCATGVFVLYNQEEFDSDSDDEVRILAGADTCLQPGSVKSIVFAQKYNKNGTAFDGITVFNGERFNTADTPLKITEDTQFDDASLLQFGKIQSFMIIGKSPWTVTTRYRTFCFRPEGSGEFPICPVARASTFILPEELDWLSVRHGCEIQTELEDVPLTYCFEFGSGNLELISDGSDNKTEELDGRAWGQGPFARCGALDEFALLLRFRLTNDFDSAYQIQFPRNKANSWRTEILDYTMEIVDLCTVDTLVDKQILRVVREMYVYLAEKLLWSKGEGWPSKPWQRVLLVAHETKRCLTEIADKDWLKVAIKLSEDIVKKMDHNGIKESDIDQEFKPVNNYDIAMEFVWLSINYVGAACHAALQYETDFWVDYINVAYDMYLQPMAKYWGNARDVIDYYPILLGGFETKLQHRSMAAVTTSLYKAVSLPKLERPKDVIWG